MEVELPGESKSFADIKAGECFAFTREQVTSVCMKVEWLSSASVAVLWSASDDWTVPHLIAPTEIAGSILHSLPSAIFVASSDAKDVRADRTRHEYAPGFLIKTPTGQSLIAVKGLQREHGTSVIDVATGKASGIETDNLTFFTSWRMRSNKSWAELPRPANTVTVTAHDLTHTVGGHCRKRNWSWFKMSSTSRTAST